jgi:CheY-like chemotaxis protein
MNTYKLETEDETAVATCEHVAVRVGTASQATLQRPRVLVAGCQGMDLKLIEMVLSDAGMQVSVVNVEELASASVAAAVEAIVVEWELSAPDTLVMLKQLRKLPFCMKAPLIAVSRTPAASAIRRDLSILGVRWILKKPIAAASLPKLVLKTIGETKSTRASRAGNVEHSIHRIPVLDMGQTMSSAGMEPVR